MKDKTNTPSFGILLFQLAHWHRSVRVTLERNSGLSWNAIKVLAFLVRTGECVAQQQISDGLKLNKASVTIAVDELEAAGLAARVGADYDRRVNLIELRALDRACSILSETRKTESEILLRSLSVPEQREFGRLLYKALRHEKRDDCGEPKR